MDSLTQRPPPPCPICGASSEEDLEKGGKSWCSKECRAKNEARWICVDAALVEILQEKDLVNGQLRSRFDGEVEGRLIRLHEGLAHVLTDDGPRVRPWLEIQLFREDVGRYCPEWLLGGLR